MPIHPRGGSGARKSRTSARRALCVVARKVPALPNVWSHNEHNSRVAFRREALVVLNLAGTNQRREVGADKNALGAVRRGLDTIICALPRAPTSE
jgi:hypothetical protein